MPFKQKIMVEINMDDYLACKVRQINISGLVRNILSQYLALKPAEKTKLEIIEKKIAQKEAARDDILKEIALERMKIQQIKKQEEQEYKEMMEEIDRRDREARANGDLARCV